MFSSLSLFVRFSFLFSSFFLVLNFGTNLRFPGFTIKNDSEYSLYLHSYHGPPLFAVGRQLDLGN